MRDLTRRVMAAHHPALLSEEGRRPSAVLLLLYERDGQEHVLFQVRTQEVADHKGEVSLPGGRRDSEDASPLATALRETHEEIGVAPEDIEVFGRLDDVVTLFSNFLIAPFVGAITRPGTYPFRFARREVAEMIEVPLPHLMSDGCVEWSVREVDGERVAERAFLYGEHRIWGATARVLGQYVDLLAPALASGGGA